MKFEAKLGPFGLFVNNGTAGIGADITLGLKDVRGNGRLVLLGYGGSGVESDLGRIGDFLVFNAVDNPVVEVALQAGQNLDTVQAVSVLGTGGTFRLQLSGQETRDIQFNADPNTGANSVQWILGEKVAPTDILSVNKFHNTYVITFKGAVGNDLALKFNKATFSNTSGAITFAGTIKNSGCANPNVAELACVDLPIFVGTESSQVPIDFLGKTPGQKNHLTGHVSLDLGKLFSGDIAGAFTYGFTPPDWGDFDFQTPSIFALLSDPATIVDGVDRVLGAIQDAFQGQIFGAKLPFLANALGGGDNPIVRDIQSFRVNVLQRLAKTIRDNNLDLEHLQALIQRAIFDAINAVNPKLLHEVDPTTGLPGQVVDDVLNGITDPKLIAAEIAKAIPFKFLDASRTKEAPIFTAKNAEFNLTINKSYTFDSHDIPFNLGIPALGISGDFKPQIQADFTLHFGVGVSLDKGFYLVTDGGTPGNPLDDTEVSLALTATFSSVNCTAKTVDRANIKGNLLFLALKLTDGLDMNGDGKISVSCAGNHPSSVVTPQTEELTKLYFSGSVDMADAHPVTLAQALTKGTKYKTLFVSGLSDKVEKGAMLIIRGLTTSQTVTANDTAVVDNCASVTKPAGSTCISVQEFTATDLFDLGRQIGGGMLTISDLISTSPLKIFQIRLDGGAMLRANAVVDFSTLGEQYGNILPSVDLKILIDFPISWTPGSPVQIAAPQIVIADITLDLGSFISKFAKPIFDKIKSILSPLSWLIGPDGFLNKRIPLLSDLAGHTVTGKDLVVLFDPEDGPKVVAFLNFVDQLFYLAKLIDQASSEASVGLNFGDLILFENVAQRCGAVGVNPNACTPNLNLLKFIDNRIDLTGSLGGVTDVRQLTNLGNVKLPDPKDLLKAAQQGSMGSATSSFTAGVTKPGAIYFKLLEPSTIFHLILGQPADIVIIQLPEFGFNFFYRQVFPIIGPLAGTFAGAIGATVSLAFGYDTTGLVEVLHSKNAAQLLDGFFIDALDPARGADRPRRRRHLAGADHRRRRGRDRGRHLLQPQRPRQGRQGAAERDAGQYPGQRR
ncbi:MAG: hypothetical protein E6I84_15745 [Chloroflexi bacterium]|nr:MAG: hypothetical protein E6I84_15745 [Chloroflexota bacterium]